jgi:hypothetical protein
VSPPLRCEWLEWCEARRVVVDKAAHVNALWAAIKGPLARTDTVRADGGPHRRACASVLPPAGH